VEAIRRTNGKWFNIGIVEAVEYVHAEINWCELDCENLGVVTQYILQARLATAPTFVKSHAKKAA
jgi:hypothetical protein